MSLPSPADCLARISEIVGVDITIPDVVIRYRFSDYDTAKLALMRVRDAKKALRFLKKEISTLLTAVRSEFTSARTQVGKGFGNALAAGFFGRRTMGRVNSSERDRLRRRQLEFVAPYEDLKVKIDLLVGILDNIKFQIETSDECRVREKVRILPAVVVPPLVPPPLPSLPPPPPPVPPIRYYVYLADMVQGPFLLDHVLEMRDGQAIVDDTLVCREGSQEWTTFKDGIAS